MAKKEKIRSGVIPYYIDEGEIKLMMMRPSNKNFGGNSFQIAKGKLGDDEDPLEGGLREAGEELGLFKGNIEHTHNLGKFLGRTHFYICKIKDPSMFGDTCYETAETKWMTPDEFEKEGRDLHKSVVKAAVRYIKNKEGIK